jgi:hypothetical protein
MKTDAQPAIVVSNPQEIQQIERDKPYYCADCTQTICRKAVEDFSDMKNSHFLICPFCLTEVNTISKRWRK